MTVYARMCQTWSETLKTSFLMSQLSCLFMHSLRGYRAPKIIFEFVFLYRDLSNNELTKLPNGGDFSNLVIPNRTDIGDTLDFSGNRINVLPSNTFANLTIYNTL